MFHSRGANCDCYTLTNIPFFFLPVCTVLKMEQEAVVSRGCGRNVRMHGGGMERGRGAHRGEEGRGRGRE